jgi:copper transport protein
MLRTNGGLRFAPLLAILALLVAPALPGATGNQVAAHAQLVASSPAAGETVAEPPDELRLIFSERLEDQVTSLDIRAGDGTVVVSRGGSVDPDDRYALVLAAPDLADSVYTVTWRTLSADDGHTAEGFFSFAIGTTEAAIPGAGHAADHAEADPLRVAGRWLTYLGLLLALGMPIFHAVVLRYGPMPRSLLRLLAVGLGISAVATLVVVTAAALEADAFPAYLVETRNGLLHLARAGVALAGVVALLVLPAALAGIAAAGAGLGGIVLLVAAGHASAVPGVGAPIGHVVHVAGVAIWASGVVALLLLVLRPSLLTGGAPLELRSIVPRFSALALVSIAIVGLTGLYAAWTQAGVIVSTETAYGRTLIVKLLIAIAGLGIGGLTYLDGGRLLRWLPAMRTRLGVETAAIAGVLLASAVLAITPPAEEAGGVAIEPIPDAFGLMTPGMAMEVAPGRPGVNRIIVTTTDALAMSAELELSLDRLDTGSTTRVVLRPEGDHPGMDHGGTDHGGMTTPAADGSARWSADALILPAGSAWDTTVRVLLPGTDREVDRQRYAFTLDGGGIATGARRTLLDPATIAGGLLLLGGGLAVGLGLGGVRLPRTEAVASRVALLGGGGAAAASGAAIGLQRVLGA